MRLTRQHHALSLLRIFGEMAVGIWLAFASMGSMGYLARLGFTAEGIFWMLKGIAVISGVVYGIAQPLSRAPLMLWAPAWGIYVVSIEIANDWLCWPAIRESAYILVLSHVGWAGIWHIRQRRGWDWVRPGEDYPGLK